MSLTLIIIEKIAAILIISLGILLAFWVYFKDKKAKTNTIFFWMTILLVLWIGLTYLFSYLFRIQGAGNAEQASTLMRMIFGVVTIWFIPAYYFFVVHFPKISLNRNFLFEKIIVLTISFFSLMTFFTSFIIKEVSFDKGYPAFSFGELALAYYIFIFSLVVSFIVALFKKYSVLSHQEKIKVQYVLIGTIIFCLINIIFNILLPIFQKGGNDYLRIGNYSTIIFLIFTALSIVKRELFGIKVILTQFLVIVMGLILLIVPFLIGILWLKILLFAVFVLFCVFGYLLIGSTLREVRQKEILEEKVKERTQTINEKMAELDRWYKVTVGRELRMAELKEKIKEMEKDKK